MPVVSRTSSTRAIAAALALACLAGPFAWATAVPSRAEPALSKMFAIYRIHFLGAKLGKFKLWADFGKKTYKLRSETKLEMGFIIRNLFFELKGDAKAEGALEGGWPKPTGYTMDFKTKGKRGKLDMTFADNVVDRVVTEPEMLISSRAVPVTRAHVTDVLDPLAAAFLTKLDHQGKTHGAACEQTVAVFDGKHRFNLVVSHKKTVRVTRSGKRGYAGIAVICRVKYAPVAGHTPSNKGLKFFEESDDIEVWLIPVPGTRAYVPYHLSLPTPYGKAAAISTVFQVHMPGKKSISLVQ